MLLGVGQKQPSRTLRIPDLTSNKLHPENSIASRLDPRVNKDLHGVFVESHSVLLRRSGGHIHSTGANRTPRSKYTNVPPRQINFDGAPHFDTIHVRSA